MAGVASPFSRLLTVVAFAVVFARLGAPAVAHAEPDARQRQAAAEAYDQGTAAYVARDFEKAAQWYETANRLAPAAPALIQSARAHLKAGNLPRAATLALRLTMEYPDDATASEVGRSLLAETADELVRVDVVCEGCSLDVEGTLQDFPSFFIEPDKSHTVTASFETGSLSQPVTGAAGETKSLSFEAPPAPPDEPKPVDLVPTGSTLHDELSDETRSGKPLPPIVTFIGAGITGALLVGSIVSTLDTNSSVDAFNSAADDANSACDADPNANDCTALYDEARGLLDDGESKETRTTILWVATGVAGAATGVIALLLTDWSGDESSTAKRQLDFAVVPTFERAGPGITAQLAGRY